MPGFDETLEKLESKGIRFAREKLSIISEVMQYGKTIPEELTYPGWTRLLSQPLEEIKAKINYLRKASDKKEKLCQLALQAEAAMLGSKSRPKPFTAREIEKRFGSVFKIAREYGLMPRTILKTTPPGKLVWLTYKADAKRIGEHFKAQKRSIIKKTLKKAGLRLSTAEREKLMENPKIMRMRVGGALQMSLVARKLRKECQPKPKRLPARRMRK